MECSNHPFYKGKIYAIMIPTEQLKHKKQAFMHSNHATSFQKFRKIPQIHEAAAVVLEHIITENVEIKQALRTCRNTLNKTEKIIATCAAQFRKEVDYILKKMSFFKNFPDFKTYSTMVLAAQLLFGHQSIPLGVKLAAELLYIEADMKESFVEADTVLGTKYLSEIPTYVRVNTLSISLEQCINAFCKEGWNLLRSPQNYDQFLAVVSDMKEQEFIRDYHISELLVFPPCTSFYDHPGYLRGKFVLQDKASCLASFLLNPKPGSFVLDMCAAPGNTTNHIANIVNNEATVYAIDNHPHRYNKLHSFMQLTNSTCVETMLADAMKIRIKKVNYILVDANSSYSGIFYKRSKDGLAKRLKKNNLTACKLLLHALGDFPDVKRVVFASCSKYLLEGEKVVEHVLRSLGDSYRILDVKQLLWNQWFALGKNQTDCGSFPFASQCLRTKPESDKCHGYFIAVFERNPEVPIPTTGTRFIYSKSFMLDNVPDRERLYDHSTELSEDVDQKQNNSSNQPKPVFRKIKKRVKPFKRGIETKKFEMLKHTIDMFHEKASRASAMQTDDIHSGS